MNNVQGKTNIIDKTVMFKGFKVIPTARIKTMNVPKNEKTILYNPRFTIDLNDLQQEYLMLFHYWLYKTRDKYKADKKALSAFKRLSKDTQTIYDLYKKMFPNNQREQESRIFHLFDRPMFEEVHLKKMSWFKRLWSKIKKELFS